MHHNKREWFFIFAFVLLISFTSQELTYMSNLKTVIHGSYTSHIEDVPNRGKRHILDNDVSYTIKYTKNGHTQFKHGTIKKGYAWSASIPTGLHWLVGGPLDEDLKNAALIHDILCDEDWDGNLRDLVFKYILKRDGVSWRRRNIMYWGVVKFRKASTWIEKKIGKAKEWV
ncbi:MAG: DUF1353 domain-containing protein [Gammaproteobacteria bacterium]|nr:DUF1353 domain-containing protein [Gammaproteobacteria bacterium]